MIPEDGAFRADYLTVACPYPLHEVQVYLANGPPIEAKDDGKSIAAFGAAAKGNTLLNYCGIGTDMVDYVADSSPHKQGLYLPGSHIPIVDPDRIRQSKPDYLLILPWNLTDEIIAENDFIRAWGGRFVVPIPTVQVIE